MPAPLTHDWEAVKATAIAMGNLKRASEAHNIPYQTIRTRACREKWPVGRRPAQQVKQAIQIQKDQLAKSNPRSVTSVTSSSEALESILAQRKETYLKGMSKAVEKATEYASSLKGSEAFRESRKVKELIDAGHKLHSIGEKEQGGTTINLNVLTMGADAFIQAKQA
jgi:hypothetical protein